MDGPQLQPQQPGSPMQAATQAPSSPASPRQLRDSPDINIHSPGPSLEAGPIEASSPQPTPPSCGHPAHKAAGSLERQAVRSAPQSPPADAAQLPGKAAGSPAAERADSQRSSEEAWEKPPSTGSLDAPAPQALPQDRAPAEGQAAVGPQVPGIDPARPIASRVELFLAGLEKPRQSAAQLDATLSAREVRPDLCSHRLAAQRSAAWSVCAASGPVDSRSPDGCMHERLAMPHKPVLVHLQHLKGLRFLGPACQAAPESMAVHAAADGGVCTWAMTCA